MRKGWIRNAALALAVSVGMAGAAQAQTVEDIVKAGTLKVGMLVDLPPFGMQQTDGSVQGLDADVARLMAKYLGVKAEIIPVTGPNRIPYLLTNKVDVLVATFGITPERAKQVSFSIPYSEIEMVVIASKDKPITSFETTANQRIAVPRAATSDMALTQYAPKETKILRFDDDASAAQALIAGQADALGTNGLILEQLQKDNPKLELEKKFVLSRQYQGVTLRKGADDLLKWTNTFIYYVKNSGELDAINRKWLKQPLNPLPTF